MGLEAIVGGTAGGGLTAYTLGANYGSTALAAATLGFTYPIAVMGGTFLGAYLGKYFKKPNKK